MTCNSNLENICTHAYHWQVDDKDTWNDKVNILIWALNRQSEPCLLRITDYPYSCYLELPNIVNNAKYRWEKNLALSVGEYLKRKYDDISFDKYIYHYKPKLYYYKNLWTLINSSTKRKVI